MKILKSTLRKCLVIFDPFLAILGLLGFFGVIAKRAMVSSNQTLYMTRWTFRKLGYLPIRDHYYEPLTFDAAGSKHRDRIAQRLFDSKKDYSFMDSIARPDEFRNEYVEGEIRAQGFLFGNRSFESGDAETLYYVIRHLKPKRIIEIGAGHSSLIIQAALKLNSKEGQNGEHIIVEPYENPWLEKLDATVLRERVEQINFSLFQGLEAGDIVFIDSSHVIRAQNDCVFEYTELLPFLPSGVVVHIHDIFTPYDYPDEWLNRRYYLWGEQYMVEALLANSDQWKVLAPLSWLAQETERFNALCPYFEGGRMPGSLWIEKNNKNDGNWELSIR